MKISRRGLGGLFAGAGLAAKEIGQTPTTGVTTGSFEATHIPYDSANVSPQPVEEQFAYLLRTKQRSSLTYYRPRSKGEPDIDDPDILALKSISPAGRDVINRTRRAQEAWQNNQEWLKREMDQLLERYPWLKAFT